MTFSVVLTGSKHEDGTQSDSENALGEQRRAAALDERSWGLWGDARTKIREGRANVPEGLFAEEDSPARRRKPSSSKVAKELVERRRGSAPVQQNRRDDYSDRGTYTVELENGDREDDEARRLIDKVKICVEQTCLLLMTVSFYTHVCVSGVWCGRSQCFQVSEQRPKRETLLPQICCQGQRTACILED